MGWGRTSWREKIVFLCRRSSAILAPFILLTLMATACNSVPGAPDLPDVELPAIPSDNSGGSISTPQRPAPTDPTPADYPNPTSTISLATPDAMLGGGSILVPRLEIAEIPTDLPEYSRSGWKHWNDTDKDCQNTRAEVLIEESAVPPTFKNEERCLVISGLWEGPYTGQSFTEASDVDIDHLVPLKNAHLSGGWQWDDDRREDYANSMTTDYHLIAVEKYANRAKGARGPEEWRPPDTSYHCEYAYYWIAVKAEWGLTATNAEWSALEKMLSECTLPVEIVKNEEAGTAHPDLARFREQLGLSTIAGGNSATLVATPTPEPFSGSLVITEILPDPSAVRDAAGEWFEVHNPDPDSTVNLQGWAIRKGAEDGPRISDEVKIPPLGYVVLARNGNKSTNGGISVGYEYQGISLTNDGDIVELVAPSGRIVDRVEYGEGLVFPGAATSLDPGATDAGANDDPANWCRATSALPNGDFGTPGAVNDSCP